MMGAAIELSAAMSDYTMDQTHALGLEQELGGEQHSSSSPAMSADPLDELMQSYLQGTLLRRYTLHTLP